MVMMLNFSLAVKDLVLCLKKKAFMRILQFSNFLVSPSREHYTKAYANKLLEVDTWVSLFGINPFPILYLNEHIGLR